MTTTTQQPPPTSTGLSNQQLQNSNAYQLLEATLQRWGLQTLAPVVLKLMQQGYTDRTSISYLLQQTPEYQQRFAGNQQRIKNGLAPLTPAQYLATEASYQQVLRQAGLPKGFYDHPDDFAQMIGNNVSAQEVQQRAQDAVAFAQSTDPAAQKALKDYYGVDSGHIAAYFLDQNRALPLLQKQATAAMIGAAALDQGLQATSRDRAELYADLGVSGGQAQNAYQQVAAILPDESKIAARFGQSYTQSDAEDELLGGLASAQRKRQHLNQQETDLFSGSGGAGDSFYHPGYGLGESSAGAF